MTRYVDQNYVEALDTLARLNAEMAEDMATPQEQMPPCVRRQRAHRRAMEKRRARKVIFSEVAP